MEISKEEYLQNVLNSNKFSHIDNLIDKYKEKRDEVKEELKNNYQSNIYNPLNSGSFAKHTAINSKFDLDIVVSFKKAAFETLQEMFDDVFEFLNENYNDKADIRKQKVSIGIEFFPDKDGDIISLDIVPGRELNQDQYSEDKKINLYVNLLYGTLQKKTYIQTNIQAQIDHIKAKENERKVIRLLKIWKNSNQESYKSFLLELLTIKAFDKEDIKGNLWEKLKLVMQYIKNNITDEEFTLKDPGNSNNNVIETLETWERQFLFQKMNIIINSIKSNEDNLKIYFPTNSQFDNSNNSSNLKAYGLKDTKVNFSIPPDNQRFG
ncbi:MAG: nucleotidyltransferase [Cyanobacteria bacterium J06621_8]